MTTTRPTPPQAPRDRTVHRVHGLERPDDYHWLRTDGKQGERVLAYLDAENQYLAEVLAPHEALVDAITDELRSHIQEQDEQPPVQDGDWLYSTRTEAGQAHPVFVRRPLGAPDAPAQVLLDLNALKAREKHDNVWVGAARPSPDGRSWAYLLDTSGQEVFELRVLDTQNGELREAPLPGVSGWTLAWSADGRQLYYVTEDETQRPYRLWRHTLGRPQTEDTRLMQEDDPTFRLEVRLSADGQTLLVGSSASLSTEWQVLSTQDAGALPRLLLPREPQVETLLEDGGDHWLVLTNQGGAREFKVVRLPKTAGGPLDWSAAQDVLPHDEQRYLTGMRLFANHLLISGREDGYSQLWVLPRVGGGYGEARRVTFPEASHTVQPGTNRVFHTDRARVLYSSLTRPLEHLDLDLSTLQTTLIKATPVPGYDPAQYVAEQRWISAPDGEQVPVSLVRHRDTPLPAPTLLYGYGSYGFPAEPAFSASRLPLLDRGWVWATAHIRGGSERGRRWYDAGRLEHKMNSFTDFVAVGEGLIEAGVTQAGRLAAMGRSAGGLLMGAVVNLRPDLFAAAFVGVPFVDVLSTMLDASLPLTTGEYDEWGNPQERHWYDVMARYSPYDNLKAGVYPHLFVSGGLNDPRVPYWEPAKYAARVRSLAQPGSGTTVLKTHLGAGHGGSSGRFDALRETAEEYAFLLSVLGDPA
ncbi:S9 family peptidase [Deinococcus irradiatisoli]|uniref:S9 family peptidase n=1 Tax=Deinococcus irradiatisoli TaxID=2202254 RepID=A0A2Z3JG73_9DEIO|nr:S9 family peptidase [Deinococcus irradiatisoli]AWN22360.1 S9 family peptidase [Deinococcus irradiatisoli]